MSRAENEEIGVLGLGRFGAALAGLLVEKGYRVWVHDPRVSARDFASAPAAEIAARCGVIFFAVPQPSFREALAELCPYLRATQIVVDVGSVKVEPVAIMTELLADRVPWVASHPLFGPASLRLAQTIRQVIVCPNPQHEPAVTRVSDIYRRLECQVTLEEPQAHDRRMAHTHALTFFVAKGLLEAGVTGREEPAPASFRAVAQMLETVQVDAGHLFRMLHHHNPFAAQARQRLVDALREIHRALGAAQLPPRSSASHGESNGLRIPALPAAQDSSLCSTRELIDIIDHELLDLVARRLQLARRAGSAKQRRGLALRDPEREEALLEDRRAQARRLGIREDQAAALFQLLMQLSREVQSH